jgi:aspartate aminotransferase
MSATLKVSGLAKKMKREGLDVWDFSVGEPDLDTPDAVKEAGKRAIAQGRTKYTPNEGIPELREAIAEKLRLENGLDYEPDQILVSTGAKASLYFAAMALFQKGDKVIVPMPYWVSYPEQVKLAGAKEEIVLTEEGQGFKLSAEQLREGAPDGSKGIILNYPSNPTGNCYGKEDLEPLAEACLEKDLFVVADEIYEKLLYDGKTFTSIAAIGPEIRERTIVVNGVSKSYAMTGWRIGYAAGPREVIKGMARIQSHSTSNACSVSQWAALEALTGAREEASRMAEIFRERRDEMLRCLAEVDGVSCARPDGAFYIFPNVSRLFGRSVDGVQINSGQDLALYLLENAQVAVVPGEAFGSKDHIRISYAASVETIREGMGRIAEAVGKLRPA